MDPRLKWNGCVVLIKPFYLGMNYENNASTLCDAIKVLSRLYVFTL